jgi:hypothetical protein
MSNRARRLSEASTGSADVFTGRADVFTGSADVFTGSADVFTGSADVFTGSADVSSAPGVADVCSGGVSSSGVDVSPRGPALL